MLQSVELAGTAVKLMPLEKIHEQELYEAAKPKEIWEHLPIKVHSLSDMKRLIESALKTKQEGRELPFAVFDIESHSIVGSTRFLDISLPNKSVEIGWTWYHPSVWRTRVNTECKYLLLKYCFEELKLHRVQFKTDVRNNRSRAAIKRLGATQEGISRKHMVLPDGYVRDSVIFSVIDDEWPFVKKRLESFLHAASQGNKENTSN
ncbi:GNAT family N-acetyltransferase [Priestia sp. JV24]|uniref:GNAT family N-acetyltransferase n=1 Tax=Priestia TaxID=2800373 RepID=UPI0021D668ED|nr:MULTISPECIES: GNAT family protein [Priestia]MCU7709359.1 GNAT family N-acetyltransferase [Priestia megaterium]MCW1046906.1 GNAT family N-acetyltransferase [Priestia sp. JV24]